jgi:flagellar basal-body rod modification protein FlgD
LTVQGIAPQPAPPAPARQTASNAATLSSDFETFIRMLTAQARYQDPLEPLDSSQYATQLAQFSMVEQQVLANDRLAGLSAALATGNMAALAGWVGMEARAPAPARWAGDPIEVVAPRAAGADTATLVIETAHGVEVARRSMPPGGDAFVWDGRDDAGSVLPYGTYSLSVESSALGVVVGREPAQVYARVVEAQVIDGKTLLLLDSGARIATERVSALRNRQGG